MNEDKEIERERDSHLVIVLFCLFILVLGFLLMEFLK